MGIQQHGFPSPEPQPTAGPAAIVLSQREQQAHLLLRCFHAIKPLATEKLAPHHASVPFGVQFQTDRRRIHQQGRCLLLVSCNVRVAIQRLRIFALEHELMILRQLSVMIRIRMLLGQRHLALYDAFRAFNASQNGLLNCSELYGGLVWLGLPVNPQEVYGMVKYMDKDAFENEIRQVRGWAGPTCGSPECGGVSERA